MLEKVCRKGNFLHCWWECKLVQPLWKTVWSFIKQTTTKKTELPYDLAIPLLGIYLDEPIIQGGLACCSSWGGKESDTTERLN